MMFIRVRPVPGRNGSASNAAFAPICLGCVHSCPGTAWDGQGDRLPHAHTQISVDDQDGKAAIQCQNLPRPSRYKTRQIHLPPPNLHAKFPCCIQSIPVVRSHDELSVTASERL